MLLGLAFIFLLAACKNEKPVDSQDQENPLLTEWDTPFGVPPFDKIKSEGVLDPAVGDQFKGAVLAPGGSLDPDLLLKNFLGRAPQSDAFFEDLGIKQ